MGICRLYVRVWEGERDSQKHKRTHLCEGNHWLNLTCEILQMRNWDRFAPKKILIHPRWDVSRVANRLGPLQPVPKFFLRMCSSPGQAPHFLVGAPNPQLSHLHGDICIRHQNSVFSSSLLFIDPCSDFCYFYLLVWGRLWGTGWGTCLILLLKKRMERKKRVCCLSSWFQSVAEECARALVCWRIYGWFPVNPGIVHIFSYEKSLLCMSVSLVSPWTESVEDKKETMFLIFFLFFIFYWHVSQFSL